MTPAALTAKYPPWHVFTSDEGRWWAASTDSPFGGSGQTIDADTGEDMAAALAAANTPKRMAVTP